MATGIHNICNEIVFRNTKATGEEKGNERWDLPHNLRSQGDSYIIWGGLLVAMVMANTWGCRHYLRSLDAASNSVAPTIISAASSYVLSGVIGITLFEEASSMRWWAGAMMIVFGLALVARPRNKHKAE